MLVIEEKGKQGYQDKNLTERRWELTTTTPGLEPTAGQIGGRPVLSPLRHLALQNRIKLSRPLNARSYVAECQPKRFRCSSTKPGGLSWPPLSFRLVKTNLITINKLISHSIKLMFLLFHSFSSKAIKSSMCWWWSQPLFISTAFVKWRITGLTRDRVVQTDLIRVRRSRISAVKWHAWMCTPRLCLEG